ncbi:MULTISPECIES: hypothetical protein [unclassified Fusibacter]|uniref:hypothetical protein n=1 Tax=unclassified Fusibacter TaxID=2624464 RepID=UPI00101216E8|nr:MULTISPECIES: hypothetical protein [unclassified Fusibacter]MCK8060892.1 hypothetical protein [Fusibacter sp. A2]NPE23188.1 hypothetical protein [Fusibacter sp. A1]RXV59546.1 hypothetical protein DWB64_15260 [Fusibacter sp. A1]
MSKRHIVLTVLMLLMLCTAVFATESNNGKLPPVEIVSPKINAYGDVMHTQDLFISLKVNEDVDAVLTLVRLDKPRISLVTAEVKKLNQIALDAPTDTLKADPSSLDVPLDPIITAVSDRVFAEEMARDVLQEAYVSAGLELKSSYDAYLLAYNKARLTFEEDLLNTLVLQRKLLSRNLNDLHLKRQAYEKAAVVYLDLQDKYESMFRINIVDHTKVVIEGALPFFNMTVRDINTGRYELIIEDAKTGDLVVDKMNITIKKEDEAALEMINRVKEELTEIWTIQ